MRKSNLAFEDAPPTHISSYTETRLLTLNEIDGWTKPRFQRPIRFNAKVAAFCEKLKTNGGVIGGIITLGMLPGDDKMYIVDGSHRLEAARRSGLDEFYAEVRIREYVNYAQMAADFVELDTALVRMRPDDILRGMEENTPVLQQLREACPFVGYTNIRQTSPGSVLLSMSATLRCWRGSSGGTPTVGGNYTYELLCDFLGQKDELPTLIAFLNSCNEAWDHDPENFRLWGNLNIIICMWLYREMVHKQQTTMQRHVFLTRGQFTKCLMILSTSSNYSEWLYGRHNAERDRSPCYRRVRELFIKRLAQEFSGRGFKMPAPDWYAKS